ncbi:hypothetical protein ACNI3K_03860 [Demequina sp. SO4-13]|uniref:hypothetical protein n=1 Tax=Demequina sp. SO4-13 TaxID=3401027 RepID=UPI003AF82F96
MRELRDVIHEAYARHARALGDGGADSASVTALDDIRRRRTRRSAVAIGGAAAASGAIAFAAIAMPATLDDGATVAAPAPGSGAPAWCYLEDYPAPNPEAFGPAGFEGRVYADYEDESFVFVSPEGEVQRMERNDDGIYEALKSDGRTVTLMGEDGPGVASYAHLAIDYFDNGGAGGAAYLTDPEGPRLGYEWTTVAPNDAPSWVDPQLLMEVHTGTLGFSATGLEPAVAGADAVVESVIRYDDGTEEVVRIGRGEPGPGIRGYDGLQSASIRATLPGGESYEITSHYDASQTYEQACGVSVPILADDTREDDDSGPVSEPGNYVAGPYLEGPESSTFQCLAPVPDELIAEPTRLERQTGKYYDRDEAGIEFDFGEGGYVLGAPEKYFEGVEWQGRMHSGWTSTSFERSGQIEGNVVYEALIWVDEDGVIVAHQQHYTPEDEGLTFGPGQDDLYPIPGSQNGDRLWYIGDTSDLALPCEGVDPSEVEDAEVGLIWGYGPSADDMRWSVLFPERG